MRRTFALAALLLAALPALAQTRITLGYLPSNAFLAAFVAKDEGFFAKHGLDVSFDLLPDVPMLRQALARGSLQAGTLTPPAVLRADDGRATIQIVAGAALQTREHPYAGIMAGEHSHIQVARDFRGKKVGVPGLGGVNHIAFMAWLQDHGVDPRGVRYAPVLLPRMADALKSGRVDAALPIEPYLDQIVQGGGGYLVAKFPGDLEHSYLQALYVMPRSWARAHPQAVTAFRDALRESVQWIARNEQAARRTQMRYLNLAEPSAMAAKLPEYVTDVRPSDVEFWIKMCRRFGVARQTAPVAELLVD